MPGPFQVLILERLLRKEETQRSLVRLDGRGLLEALDALAALAGVDPYPAQKVPPAKGFGFEEDGAMVANLRVLEPVVSMEKHAEGAVGLRASGGSGESLLSRL